MNFFQKCIARKIFFFTFSSDVLPALNSILYAKSGSVLKYSIKKNYMLMDLCFDHLLPCENNFKRYPMLIN